MEKVDVDKLEREMVSALQADRRYSRENDAKFRAVNQRVQSYEEFRYEPSYLTYRDMQSPPPGIASYAPSSCRIWLPRH